MAHDVHLTETDLERVREHLRANYNPQDHQEAQELILGALQDVQHMFGWVPFEAARAIAEHLGVSENLIYGLLTFYADFRTEPPGLRKAMVRPAALAHRIYVAEVRHPVEVRAEEEQSFAVENHFCPKWLPRIARIYRIFRLIRAIRG